MIPTTISKAFSCLPDPRLDTLKRHPFINILTISICAIIAGCDDFQAISEYGKSKKDWFGTFLDLPHGIPSRDTFNDVLNRLNPQEFAKAFTQWVCSLGDLKGDIIALDGKVMRGTLDRAKGNPATHLVSAWSVKNKLCFGQVKVSDKSNEITAIPKLLKLLDIEGATITTDAMGTQYKIADQIIKAKGDFILALKGNQGEFHDDITLFLKTQINKQFSTINHDAYSEIEGDHGRIEERNVWVTHEIDGLIERHPRWQSVNGIVLVESKRELGGKTSCAYRYYITSHQQQSAQFIANAIRSHWHVENKLHWQLDVSFNEDKNRLRSGAAAQNFSLMNKIALNLLKNETSIRLGIKNKRLKADWDNKYMIKVLTVGVSTG